MSGSIYLEDLLQQPLYQAVDKCIDREVTDTYNYHEFFSSWNEPMVDYKAIIRELFRVDESRLESFIERRKPFRENLKCLDWIELASPNISKKLLRFLLALPMCEYEIVTNNNALSKSTGSQNQFSKSLSPFKYDDKYITRIDDEEIASTIRSILRLAPNENIIDALGEFAFKHYKLVEMMSWRMITNWSLKNT